VDLAPARTGFFCSRRQATENTHPVQDPHRPRASRVQAVPGRQLIQDKASVDSRELWQKMV